MSRYNKIMIFIDGTNIFLGCRRLNINIRYEKFINLLKKDRNIIRIYYYSGVDTPISKNQKKFLKMLKHLEIETITRPLKLRKIKCEKCGFVKQAKFEKGIDASLSTDLLWFASQNGYDTAILISGDADFIPPIKRVKLLGKRIELWAFKHTLGKELRNLVDKVYYIDDIIDQIT